MSFLLIDRLIDGKVGVGKVSKGNVSGFTEDWLPVRAIQNNMIIVRDGNKVTGVKITPRNIFILDPDTQNNILIGLRNFYNTIDYEFWLIVADRPVDIKMYLSQLQLDFDNAQTQAIRKLIAEDIQKAELFSGNDYNVVDTEYYILFRDKNLDVINKRVQQLITQLASIGLISSKASDEDLKFLLQNFLNGGQKNEFGTVVTYE